jgi:hypothetical protein
MSSAADRLKLYADAQPPGSAILPCGGGPMLWMSDLREALAQLNRAPAGAVVAADLAIANRARELAHKYFNGGIRASADIWEFWEFVKAIDAPQAPTPTTGEKT